ncbi:MAG TPA: hypothetical protein VJ183_03620 [Chloroflexia bacterium]|nr:hypothetical protein [Chloroflexia bacterium]
MKRYIAKLMQSDTLMAAEVVGAIYDLLIRANLATPNEQLTTVGMFRSILGSKDNWMQSPYLTILPTSYPLS